MQRRINHLGFTSFAFLNMKEMQVGLKVCRERNICYGGWKNNYKGGAF